MIKTRKTIYWEDKFGDLWVRINDQEVMRVRDKLKGGWFGGKGLKFYEYYYEIYQSKE